MTCLIYNHSERLAAWAAAHIGHVGRGFGPCQAIGLAAGTDPEDASAQLYAVIVWHDWQPLHKTMQLSVASRSPKWVHRDILRALFHYPFVQCNCFKIWVAMPHDNARAIRFNLGLGFRAEGTLRHHFGPGRHAVIQGLLEQEWRFTPWCGVAELRRVA